MKSIRWALLLALALAAGLLTAAATDFAAGGITAATGDAYTVGYDTTTNTLILNNTTISTGSSTPAKELSSKQLPFTDVATGAWYQDAIRYVWDSGLMAGTTNTRFTPNGAATRGMLATILYRLAGEPNVSGGGFSDVAPAAYYAAPVAWASTYGIVTGYSDSTFAPNSAITREQLATLLYRYALYLGYDVSLGENTSLLSYRDSSKLHEYAVPAFRWACGMGILKGDDNGYLNPQKTATRAEVAAVLMRFYEETL